MTKRKSPPLKDLTAITPSEEGFQPIDEAKDVTTQSLQDFQSITSIETDTPLFDDDPSKEDVPPLITKAEVSPTGPMGLLDALAKDSQLVVTDPPRDPDLVDPALVQLIANDQLALKDLPTNATLKDLTALQDALITLDVKPADVFAYRVNLETGQVTIVTIDARKLHYPPNN